MLTGGSGKCLDRGRGRAKKNKGSAPSPPASTMAEWEMRSAENAATLTRMVTPVYLSDDVPEPGPQSERSAPTSRAMVVDADYYRVNRPVLAERTCWLSLRTTLNRAGQKRAHGARAILGPVRACNAIPACTEERASRFVP